MSQRGCRKHLRRPRHSQGVTNLVSSQRSLERAAIEGESPVDKRDETPDVHLSTMGHEESCGKLGGPPSKAKYPWLPIVNQYREGKVKRTPGGE